jgi:hypothetical protein
MNARGWSWWLCVGLLACGGQVEEPSPEDIEGEQGAGSSSSSGGDGQSTGAGSSGPSCAATQPHPDYPLCYQTQNPACLVPSSPQLADRLPAGPGPVSRGPWVGASSQCRMLCCYAP